MRFTSALSMARSSRRPRTEPRSARTGADGDTRSVKPPRGGEAENNVPAKETKDEPTITGRGLPLQARAHAQQRHPPRRKPPPKLRPPGQGHHPAGFQVAKRSPRAGRLLLFTRRAFFRAPGLFLCAHLLCLLVLITPKRKDYCLRRPA